MIKLKVECEKSAHILILECIIYDDLYDLFITLHQVKID